MMEIKSLGKQLLGRLRRWKDIKMDQKVVTI
jgi:hypothetical protein